MNAKLVRATLADQVHSELRTRILSGQLPSGHRLLPEELATDLAISQTPIKEALLKLEADGLVVNEMRRGSVVRLFTLREVEDLYEARILIELEAIDAAFSRGAVTEELLDELEQDLKQHGRYLKGKSLSDLTTALAFDRAFHHRLILARDNGVIAAWHQRILAQTHTAYVYLQAGTNTVLAEHRDILDGLAAGSASQAKDALKRHLFRSRDSLLTLLTNVQARQRSESERERAAG
jgi:DNA-binding GntR family transcriptional regulator